ncbi:helix-turn-helix transcriptional regulator [Treponema pedis]|uniref:helix-turn-helix transcriptional regulator n=1 Tax=Treponema pedis TaxID=409322 RepID=UPI00197D0B50|nr:YafY family protein [Treponema pedis]QSI04015.1 YafY family transcriptional regulator [Treponema pedis]
MKIERILEIIIYLMNRDSVSARSLAEHFKVSVRTIQRDMISISSAGIPVYSLNGKRGGYSILPSYKIKNINIKENEQEIIINALKSLATSYSNDTLNSLIEKYNAIIERKGGQKIFWDFSVAKENRKVQEMNVLLEKAVSVKSFVGFDYKNTEGIKSSPCVEPLAIHYKWYAWYLFAYSKTDKEYKTFKIARMQNLRMLNRISKINHGNIEERMKEAELAYYKTCIRIEVRFLKEELNLMEEYFPDCPIEELSCGIFKITINVPARERLWKALLLSFGSRVKVIGPESYKSELIKTAQNFLSNYDIQVSHI